MLKIKLQRVGKKHDPSFRVVVTDRRTGPKSNKNTAIVGHYDAIRKTISLKADEIKKWIKNGAKPTETVHNILVKEGVIKGKKVNVLPKKLPVVDEEKIAKEKEEAKIKAEKDEKEREQRELEAAKEDTQEIKEGEEAKEELKEGEKEESKSE